LHSRDRAVYPFFMRAALWFVRRGVAVFAACLAASCASSARKSTEGQAPDAAKPPTADERRMAAASEDFRLGRDAALAGDFQCARYQFGRAIATLRPQDGGPVSPELQSFSFELYDGIQRYEALAGATEEAGTSHGEVTPELAADIEAPVASPEAIASARQAVASDLPTARPDVPITVNDSVLRVVAAFQSDTLHPKIAAGLSRSGRYVPMIHRIFAEEGLPQDLAMIAFIESSFLPHARSPKSAHGIWQFMPRTGRQYGLESNGIVDERSDPEKATRAAAKYLAYLHELFDDWYLAMAAYNAGEGKIMRAMNRTGARDFWELARTGAIRKQTQNYVPAFLAAVLISKNPTHYGFDVVLEPPLEYETLFLERSVSLEDLSRAAALPFPDLQSLNPELRSAITPQQPEGYELKVPGGTRETMLVALAAVPTTRPPAFKTHVAKKGDSLRKIARRYGVSVASLASANSLTPRSRVARGQEIMVPVKAAKSSAKSAKPTKTAATRTARASTGTKKAAPAKSYKVKNGDTVYRIALRHGTTVAAILAVNGLGGSGLIKPGDRLTIPAK
jgi:membrane-bound lytic murein transglycosylase D